MKTEIFGLPYVAWCGVLTLVVIGGIAVYANGRRRALLARPVPGRVVQVTHSSNASGRVQSVMARVVVTDYQGRESEVLTFPGGRTGGVWVGRELTLWQRPDGRTPPRLQPSAQSLRSLTAAGAALAALVVVIDVHQSNVDPNSVAVLKPAGIAVAVCAAVVALVNLARLLKTQRILRGTPAGGQVLGLVRHTTTNQDNTTSTTYQPIVAFTTADGRQVFGLASTQSSYRKRWTGRMVQVRHVPGHPETFRLAKPSEAWNPALNFLLSVVMVAAGLVATAYALRH